MADELHSSDHSSLIMLTDVLNETNYTSWSRSMMVALEARDKLGFLNGEIEAAKPSDATYKQWRKVNSTLTSWIMNALSKEISRGFMFSSNVKFLWEEIRDRFGRYNRPMLYELRRNIYSAKLNGDTVASYFIKIKRYWDELDCIKPNVANDDEDRMMLFHIGLNYEYDPI
ncbi:hypothetical protein LIER_18819 [Lithospermum erythrorhizon]|uniref:Retrotransposon Copia-like N-terminal domain-containing protein n=1 Tax=Lithospermum erythrorhizon TaxID=34254 RepID=A0AAV3QFE3_LITER